MSLKNSETSSDEVADKTEPNENPDYFANKGDVELLMDKRDTYYNTLETSGWLAQIQRSFSQYYGTSYEANSWQITPGGEQGEHSNVTINNYRSFLQHQLTLVTSERVEFDVRAINTDAISIAQAQLGEQVLDYYNSHRKVGEKMKLATEFAGWSGEGFILLSWDPKAGDQYEVADTETGEVAYTGDVDYKVAHTVDMARDVYDRNPAWYIYRQYRNKYDVAARYPAHKEAIEGQEYQIDVNRRVTRRSVATSLTDTVPVYEFRHARTPACPQGRYSVFVDGQMLQDGPLPFDSMSVYRIASSTLESTNLGYTVGFDLLSVQEISDQMWSAITTNTIAFSKQLIAAKRDANIDFRTLTEGMSLVEYDEVDGKLPIDSVQLTQSSPESYKLIDMTMQVYQQLTGINEVVRGEPSANLRSGNALALIAAQAVKYNSGLQNSYNSLAEDVGTGTLEFLRKFGSAPRFFAIVGRSNRSKMKKLVGTDLKGVSRVDVRQSSALSKTTAGRVEIAQNLLEQGMISNPQDYLMVLETGRLDVATEDETSESLSVRSENETMRDGEPVQPIITDNHVLHIQKHKAILSDPAMRRDPKLTELVLGHIAEHLDLWQSAPMPLLMATGQQPPPPPPMPMGPDGQPMAPEQAGPPAADGGNLNPEMLEPAPNTEDIPNMPQPADVPPAAAPEDVAAYEQLNLGG